MQDNPLITLTTDFGYEDPFVGVMKGVILKINPRAEIIDLTHGITPQDIRGAAFAIGTSYTFFPDDTIHIVVVDPGVGSGRRPIIVSMGHHYFIGPDNGVFSYIYRAGQETPEVVHITAEYYFLSNRSPTFQARDVFCSVAAWLSRGVALSKFGDTITDYHKIELPFASVSRDGILRGEVIHIDRFGNAITNITKADVERLFCSEFAPCKIMLKGREIPFKRFYLEADNGKLCSLLNSSDFLEFFLYAGNAAAECNITVGDAVEIVLPSVNEVKP